MSLGNNFSSYTCEQWSDFGATYSLADDRSTSIWSDFGNGTVPRNVIIDSEGVVRYSAIGFNETAISAILDDLLTIVSIDETIHPESSHLMTNYPNPFNAGTQIDFELQKAGMISLSVYNNLGVEVRTLKEGYSQAGHYTVAWDTQDERGDDLPSGIYFAKLTHETGRHTQKLVLLK